MSCPFEGCREPTHHRHLAALYGKARRFRRFVHVAPSSRFEIGKVYVLSQPPELVRCSGFVGSCAVILTVDDGPTW